MAARKLGEPMKMKKIVAAGGAVSAIVSVTARGGHNPAAAVTDRGGTITQAAVAPLGAHFPGSVTADQFVCWDHQVSPPGTPGTASGNVRRRSVGAFSPRREAVRLARERYPDGAAQQWRPGHRAAVPRLQGRRPRPGWLDYRRTVKNGALLDARMTSVSKIGSHGANAGARQTQCRVTRADLRSSTGTCWCGLGSS